MALTAMAAALAVGGLAAGADDPTRDRDRTRDQDQVNQRDGDPIRQEVCVQQRDRDQLGDPPPSDQGEQLIARLRRLLQNLMRLRKAG